MATLRRSDMFKKLDGACYKAIEGATILAKARGNPYVELTHWVNQIILSDNTDWHEAIRFFALDEAKIAKDLVAAMDQLQRGASGISDFSPAIERAIKEAWMIASIRFGEGAIRSGHLLCALKGTAELCQVLHGMSGEFIKINGDLLLEKFADVTAKSGETSVQAPTPAGGAGGSGAAPSAGPAGKGEALRLYTVDMTQQALDGKIDNVVGRDEEIRKIVDILMRRRQNNPIITGDAGVGKTAVVEGFARRLSSGDVPPALKGNKLHSLDIGLLQAGASMKGEFEKRLKDVIEDVQSSETPVILFIDEAHTLIGAGGAAGQNDAANLLKPALARGQLRCIAATTYQEYIKYFEKDPALARRFQNILIDEPDDLRATQMMRGTVGALEKHHKVLVLDEALESVVKLSRRYIPARQLPDKAVSILDTACARVALSQNAEPAPLEYCRRRIEAIDTEAGILEKEAAAGFPHGDRIKALAEERKGEETKLADLQKRFEKEKALVTEILALGEGEEVKVRKVEVEGGGKEDKEVEVRKVEVEGGGKEDKEVEVRKVEVEVRNGDVPTAFPPSTSSPSTSPSFPPKPPTLNLNLPSPLTAKRKELAELQGDSPLVLAFVGTQAVAAVISEWTGIPLGRMATSEITATLNLEAELGKRIIGQDEGISLIAKRVLTARANLADPEKPIAVIMLSGPSGVGKTETALALAEQIYGSESQIVTINMSEFQEAHTVSTLKGAPPGYVGYGEGGVLTEAVRRKPYSVILLDEVEKAHPDVHEIFFQVFDKGQMEDGAGRLINFRNTIIILTTNAEGDDIKRTFPAAFLGRIQIVAYKSLGQEALYRIIDAKLGKIKKRVAENYNKAELVTTDGVKDEIIRRCDNAASGARLIDAIVNNSILPELSAAFLRNAMAGTEFKKATVDVKDNDFTYAFE